MRSMDGPRMWAYASTFDKKVPPQVGPCAAQARQEAGREVAGLWV